MCGFLKQFSLSLWWLVSLFVPDTWVTATSQKCFLSLLPSLGTVGLNLAFVHQICYVFRTGVLGLEKKTGDEDVTEGWRRSRS